MEHGREWTREIQTFSGQRHGHGGVRKGIYTLKKNEENDWMYLPRSPRTVAEGCGAH